MSRRRELRAEVRLTINLAASGLITYSPPASTPQSAAAAGSHSRSCSVGRTSRNAAELYALLLATTHPTDNETRETETDQ